MQSCSTASSYIPSIHNSVVPLQKEWLEECLSLLWMAQQNGEAVCLKYDLLLDDQKKSHTFSPAILKEAWERFLSSFTGSIKPFKTGSWCLTTEMT